MRRRALALVTAALLLAGCGSERSDSAPATSTVSPATVGSSTGDVPAALQFTAPQVGGGEIDFTRSAGRPVVLWFWAPT
jgi:ABC-type glycerol-3-phosphate transport system substrate-binding protein